MVGRAIEAGYGKDQVSGTDGAGDKPDRGQEDDNEGRQRGDNNREPAEIASIEDGCRVSSSSKEREASMHHLLPAIASIKRTSASGPKCSER